MQQPETASNGLENACCSGSASVKTKMTTPTIYKKMQGKTVSYYWLFSIAMYIFAAGSVASLLFLVNSLDNNQSRIGNLPISVGLFLVFSVAFNFCMVLTMISSYQQEPRIHNVPVIGKICKSLAPKPTEWFEALHINFMVFILILFVLFSIYVM